MSTLPLPMAVFFAGLISFLSPCVLPLVPGYVSLISGAGVEELKRPEARLFRALMLNSALFVTGFSLVFVTLGAVASALCQFAGHHMALLSRVAGAIIVVFGLHLTGLLPIKALYVDKHLRGISGGTATGAFVVGFSFGFGWTPCIGPILGAVLALSASEATVWQGAALLAVYSLGLAVPFFLTSLCVDRFLLFYGKFRRHLHRVEVASGVLLIAVGALVFTRHFALLNTWMNRIPLFRYLAERFS